MMKRCIIVNPKAGSVKDVKALRKQLERLDPATVYVTSAKKNAEFYARQAVRAGCREIIAAGGDGTLNEVINGVARHFRHVRMGLIPLGTGNDFARCLDLPSGVEQNIDIVLAGKTRAIDVVRVKTNRVRHFVNVSTGGFSGIVDEKLTPKIKRTWGSLSYVRGAAAALKELHAYRTIIRLDDKEKFSVDLYNIAIGNGRFVAGGLPITPKAKLTDGKLDVVLIPKLSKPEMAILAGQILLGKHLTSKLIKVRRARKVSVRSRPRMWFNVDGELVGNEPANFYVLPRVLKFLVNKE
jgi:diacylglycerol kinase (ATP)